MEGRQSQRTCSIAEAADLVRELVRSHSSRKAEAGFKTCKTSVAARVKGTYALKGIAGNPILSSIMPQSIADASQSRQNSR